MGAWQCVVLGVWRWGVGSEGLSPHTTGIDMQPIRNNNQNWIIFFMIYEFLGAFFLMNFYVGVVIDNFYRRKEEIGESMFLTGALVGKGWCSCVSAHNTRCLCVLWRRRGTAGVGEGAGAADAGEGEAGHPAAQAEVATSNLRLGSNAAL